MTTSSQADILLVEDNPDDVELTLRSLKKNNVTNRVAAVQDGAEALEYLFATGRYADRSISNPPKVILLDLKLPLVSGIEVLRRCKGDERTRQIPIVVLTSSREEPDVHTCYELGVNSYIVKPVDFQQFTEAVRQVGLYWLLLNEAPTVS